MRRLWIALLLLAGLMAVFPAPVPGRAQDNLQFDRVLADIWPEYDRPGVLVILRVTLSSQASLPADVSLRIPRQASQPYNVAMQDVDGMLYTLDYTTEVSGDWLVIKLATPSPEIQVEYYDYRLIRNGDERLFEFRWMSDYTVQTMSVRFQQPVNTVQLELPPDMGKGRQEQDGLVYYTGVFGLLEAGAPFTISFKYVKNGDALSATQQEVKPSQPLTGRITGQTSFSQFLPWILGGLGLMLMAGGVYWLLGRRALQAPARQQHAGANTKTQTPAPIEPLSATPQQRPLYCHQCGKRAQTGDVFCRSCGTKLRYD